MDQMHRDQYLAEAKALMSGLAEATKNGTPICSLSTTTYDTAWVSMVSKEEQGVRRWLFPQCFEAVLQSDALRRVESPHMTPVDGILDAGAALLAVLWHRAQPYGSELPSDINNHTDKLVTYLQDKLQRWDVRSSNQVGFEVLVPTLLALLAREGVELDFPGKAFLHSMYEHKMSKLKPAILYSDVQLTVIHSLEALVGRVEFDRLSHHLVDGSMMGSPSATAAYLIYSAEWDDCAESYLHSVCEHSGPRVPSAFPTTNFELTWILSALLESQTYPDETTSEQLSLYLSSALVGNSGTIGFARDILSDADDTAKALLCLERLGVDVDVRPAVERFETETCFRTYDGERDPSFSANCNMLQALLHARDPVPFTEQIMKSARFLAAEWFKGLPSDKWNRSATYSPMLLAQGFIQLLRLYDTSVLDISTDFVYEQLLVVLVQILSRTLHAQSSDHTWYGECEQTAYAIVTLQTLRALPWLAQIDAEIDLAVQNGRTYLERHHALWKEPCYTWVEKLTYGSPDLCQAYCLAAVTCPLASMDWSSHLRAAGPSPEKAAGLVRLFVSLPMFASRPKWMLEVSFIESAFFLRRLRRHRLDVFPRKNMAKDSYLDVIPFTWTACTRLDAVPALDNAVLYDMMVLSMLNYQVDEYMETVVAQHFPDDLRLARRTVSRLCRNSGSKRENDDLKRDYSSDSSNLQESESSDSGYSSDGLPAVEEAVLLKYISHILYHPKVVASPAAMQAQLRHELEVFLLAHLDQIVDSRRLAQRAPPRASYYEWVRTTSANHTSCPFSFLFFICLVSSPGQEFFGTVRQKYISQDVCRHLATMCRQFNDYGSSARDAVEQNLNSLNFPEFDDNTAKEELMVLAEYERECLSLALGQLRQASSGKNLAALDTFVRVTDLYGQIYVARDIASRMK